MHHLAIEIDIDEIHSSKGRDNVSEQYLYEDLFYYCNNGGVIKDVILREEEGRIIIADRIEFLKVQEELEIEKINAIIHLEKMSIIDNLEQLGKVSRRSIKELAEKEHNEREGIIKMIFFFKSQINERSEKIIVDFVSDFYNNYKRIELSEETNVQNISFLREANLLELASFYALRPYNRELVPKYYEFLKALNILAPLRSVNGQRIEVLERFF